MRFAPAATFFEPSRMIACASTVAVVVPSPAISDVLLATSLTMLGISHCCSLGYSLKPFASLPRLRPLSIDTFIDYVAAGKESYAVVAAFNLFEYRDEAPLFRRLSDRFEECVFGLNLVKREIEEVQGGVHIDNSALSLDSIRREAFHEQGAQSRA
jgi:hypothetical protein